MTGSQGDQFVIRAFALVYWYMSDRFIHESLSDRFVQHYRDIVFDDGGWVKLNSGEATYYLVSRWELDRF